MNIIFFKLSRTTKCVIIITYPRLIVPLEYGIKTSHVLVKIHHQVQITQDSFEERGNISLVITSTPTHRNKVEEQNAV